jgi:hypothetical protein
VASALALAVVAAATPALALLLGWVGRKDVSFSHSRPAPNVVKKRFADLALGAPPRFATGVDAARAREVGRFRVRGRRRALWVAPTTNGGYCFEWEGLFGGCHASPRDRLTHALSPSWGIVKRRGEHARVTAVEGEIASTRAARLELAYRDGGRVDVPFVYVSRPIDAGFFSFETRRGRAVKALTLYDARGRVLDRATPPPIRPVRLPLLPAHPAPRTPRRLRSTPVPPRPPLQRGAANGATVTAGANGVAVFDTTRLARDRTARLTRGVSYSCFRVTREFGIFDAQTLGIEGAYAPRIALRYFGLSTPWDGCQIQAEYGHRWPDRLGSHSVVELPLTPAGARYFTDRAAARDLALFVRSRRVHRIRKEEPRAAVRDLAAGPHGRIRFRATRDGITFWETSPTGKRFTVVVRHGRILRQNVKPYAFVF